MQYVHVHRHVRGHRYGLGHGWGPRFSYFECSVLVKNVWGFSRQCAADNVCFTVGLLCLQPAFFEVHRSFGNRASITCQPHRRCTQKMLFDMPGAPSISTLASLILTRDGTSGYQAIRCVHQKASPTSLIYIFGKSARGLCSSNSPTPKDGMRFMSLCLSAKCGDAQIKVLAFSSHAPYQRSL